MFHVCDRYELGLFLHYTYSHAAFTVSFHYFASRLCTQHIALLLGKVLREATGSALMLSYLRYKIQH